MSCSPFQAKGSEQSIESARLQMLDLAASFSIGGVFKMMCPFCSAQDTEKLTHD